MNKEKFTPGPWKVYLSKRNKKECASIVDADGKSIANTVYRFRRGERTANANLIAAAPEMYECLKHIYDCIEAGSGEFSVNRIEQILMKARGEE